MSESRRDAEREERARRAIREAAESFGRAEGLSLQDVDELDRDLWALLLDHLERAKRMDVA